MDNDASWAICASMNTANELVGSWTLEAFDVSSSEGDTTQPFGLDPSGTIIYDRGGNFAVQLANRAVSPFVSGDMRGGSDSEVRAAYEGYIAYFGTYVVDETEGFVVHKIEGSLFPNWAGQDQKRYYRLEGGALTLTTPPTPFGNTDIVAVLTWKRLTVH
jgi:hypothetical protein